MKINIFKKTWLLFTLVLIVCTNTWQVFAQSSPMINFPDSNISDRLPERAVGGPDDYGYTFNDSVFYEWIDATDGTPLGFSGYSEGQGSGPISLPFAFKYYENTYSEVYIAASGFLSFEEQPWDIQGVIPTSELPNNMIAPWWSPLTLSSTGTSNRVFYKSSGTPGNQYFVVEWYQVDAGRNNIYTFEVILYENGNFLFQYADVTAGTSGFECGSAGIENEDGLDGLKYKEYCFSRPPINKAVLFSRPSATARLKLVPSRQGSFVSSAETKVFTVDVTNTGDLGTDVYDLEVTSGWPVVLKDPLGTILTDTDLDGKVDTGPMSSSSSMAMQVVVQTPTIANIGEANSVNLTITSSLNPSLEKSVSIDQTVPAPFAQAYAERSEDEFGILFTAPNQVKTQTISTGWGLYPIIHKSTPYVYAWSGIDESTFSDNIKFAILNPDGTIAKPSTNLTNHTDSDPNISTTFIDPVIAVVPNGNIGIAWEYYQNDKTTAKQNTNIWFAMLNSAGEVILSPTNLTAYEGWGSYSELNIERYTNPRITATEDNRFFISWAVQTRTMSGYISDVFYAIRDHEGNEVLPITSVSHTVPVSNLFYNSPTLITINNDQIFLAYRADGKLANIVIDSSGNILHEEYITGQVINGPIHDSLLLSNGNIFIASNNSTTEFVFYTMDGNTFEPSSDPQVLNIDLPNNWNWISATQDQANHIILTWQDGSNYEHKNLFYALLDEQGNILTPPSAFKHVTHPYGDLQTNHIGNGNAPYPQETSGSGVDLILSGHSTLETISGITASIPVQFSNKGLDTGTGITLTATLASGLTYVSDNSGITPSVSGNTVTWNIPDLDFLGQGKIELKVKVPVSTNGAAYPVAFQITSSQADLQIEDNTTSAILQINQKQVFLPAVRR